MYARTTTIQAQPGKVEEAIDIARDSVVPRSKEPLWLEEVELEASEGRQERSEDTGDQVRPRG